MFWPWRISPKKEIWEPHTPSYTVIWLPSFTSVQLILPSCTSKHLLLSSYSYITLTLSCFIKPSYTFIFIFFPLKYLTTFLQSPSFFFNHLNFTSSNDFYVSSSTFQNLMQLYNSFIFQNTTPIINNLPL